jgi:hypothetical protein
LVVLVMTGRRVKKAPYVRLFVGWWMDSRVLSVSADARLVWLCSITFSKAEGLDGFMPAHALLVLFPGINTPPSVITAELVDAGLWQADDRDGWLIRRWADYQTTAAEDDAERESTRERKARQRAKQRNGDQTQLPLNDTTGDAA